MKRVCLTENELRYITRLLEHAAMGQMHRCECRKVNAINLSGRSVGGAGHHNQTTSICTEHYPTSRLTAMVVSYSKEDYLSNAMTNSNMIFKTLPAELSYHLSENIKLIAFWMCV